MVETLGPSGCDLNSHLSDQRGQMSALNNGARMGILAVLGTHVEDYSLLVKKYIYIYIYNIGLPWGTSYMAFLSDKTSHLD